MVRVLSIFVAILFVNTSTFAEVMDDINKTQTLQCGYVSYHPASVKNSITGEVEGYVADITHEAARRMGLKVEWSYETNWPTMPTDLQTNKFDMGCVAYWANPRSARQMLASIPLFYQPVFFVVRANDARFDANIGNVNDEGIRVSVLEGDVPETILTELYPKTKRVTLPQSASFSQVFQEVASGHADVTIAALPDVENFMASNSEVLKVIDAHPVRLYASVMQLPKGAIQLKNALDVSLREMILDGTMEKILKKYAKTPHDYYLIDYPYHKIKGLN